MVASVSFSKKIIGWFLSNMNTLIPVSRAQDLAYKGKGKLRSTKNLVQVYPIILLQGEGTDFTKILAGCSLLINRITYKIEEVISDTEIRITTELELTNFVEYKVILKLMPKVVPRVDHRDLYSNVFNAFSQEKAICIFPEGGSHDRTQVFILINELDAEILPRVCFYSFALLG